MTHYLGLTATDRVALATLVGRLPAKATWSPVVESPDPLQVGINHHIVVALPDRTSLPSHGPEVTVTELGSVHELGSLESTGIEPFLTPLLHLRSDVMVGGQPLIEQTGPDQPLWMGILNITPDSFSDGGRWTGVDEVEATVTSWAEAGVHIIDIGAESTRPNADMVDPVVEWRRIAPVLERLTERLADHPLRPLLSLDSRNVATLERGVAGGVDLINDVSGLDNPDVCAFVAASNLPVIAMHAMTVPVVPNEALTADMPAVDHIERWLEHKQADWAGAGIDLSQIIIDPGIGFGKTPAQSIELLANVPRLRSHGHRVAVGHSRKSFMTGFTEHPAAERDPETLGLSLSLARQGADIIRVHDPITTIRAHRAARQLDAVPPLNEAV